MISNSLMGKETLLDLAILDETSKLGHMDPFLLFFAASSTNLASGSISMP
jgi:hypothetical protein